MRSTPAQASGAPLSGALAVESGGRLMFALLHAAHALEDSLERALGEVGLSAAKYGPLELLAAAGEPVALSELAARLTCVPSNITQLVDRLEADGLARRVADPKDRRSKRAVLTPLGAARQAAGARQIERVGAEFAASIPAPDRALLARILAAIGPARHP